MSVKVQPQNDFTSKKNWFVKEEEETVILLRSTPATVVSLFVVSVICMNLLANKTLLQTDWIAGSIPHVYQTAEIGGSLCI